MKSTSLLLKVPGQEIQSVDAHDLFNHWLEEQTPPLRLASKRNYASLWGRFVAWTQGKGLALHQVRDCDVVDFLASLEDVNRPQRERYRLIIFRAFSMLQDAYPNASNPAEHSAVKDIDATTWRDGSLNQAKQFLSLAESAQLVTALSGELSRLQQGQVQLRKQDLLWKRKRNAAMVAVLLGCGLKALEIMALRCDAFFERKDGAGFALDTGRLIEFTEQEEHALSRTNPKSSTIHAYIHDFGGEYRVLDVPDWVQVWIEYWLQERGALHHDLLFPVSGACTGKKVIMNPATLARSITSWGELYGFELSAQKLRNSYGAQLVNAGKTVSEISQLMGFVVSAGGASRLATEWAQFSRNND